MRLTVTTATQITLLRMIFVPLFVLCISYDLQGWALLTFMVAGLTDMLDGLIARHFGQKSELGALLDPIADKLLLTAAFILLTFSSVDLACRIPKWLTILAISRDILIVISSLIIHLTMDFKKFPPTLLGKLTTTFQLWTVILALAGNYWGREFFIFLPSAWLALFFTVMSGIQYLNRALRISRENNNRSQ